MSQIMLFLFNSSQVWHFNCWGYLRSSRGDDESWMSMKGTAEVACELHIRNVSANSTKLFPSAEIYISCLSKWAKSTSSEHLNFAANQGAFIQIAAEIAVNQKNRSVYGNRPAEIFQYERPWMYKYICFW